MEFGIRQFPRNDKAEDFTDSGTCPGSGIHAMACRLWKGIMLSLLDGKHPMLAQTILRQSEF